MNKIREKFHFTPQQWEWFWRLLLVFILLAGAGLFWCAVDRVEYQWGWEKIPRYFFYQEEGAIKAPADGIVESVLEGADITEVQFSSEDGERTVLTVDKPFCKVSAGDELLDGDTIGYTKSWKAGLMMRGLWITLWISFVSSALALAIGLAAGLARLSTNFTVRMLAGIYVEVIRGTPLLVQIYIAYFLIGTVLPIDDWLASFRLWCNASYWLHWLGSFLAYTHLNARDCCGVAALALFAGAYLAEIIRAGVQAIPKGQSEAARSLGMTSLQTMRDIVLPQAFKKILPPMAGQFISLIKDSSLVSIIGIIDLTRTGREIASTTFATFEVWLTVAAVYFLVTTLLSQLVYYMERRFRISD